MLIVAARKVLVVLLHGFLVRLAVTAFPVGKIRTARHAVGTLWLSGHRFTSIKKAFTENYFSPRRLNQFSILAEYIISLVRQ